MSVRICSATRPRVSVGMCEFLRTPQERCPYGDAKELHNTSSASTEPRLPHRVCSDTSLPLGGRWIRHQANPEGEKTRNILPHVGAGCRARRIFNLNDCRWQSLRFLISRPPAQIPTAGNGRQIASPTVGTFTNKKVHDVIGNFPFTPWTNLICGLDIKQTD